jgi:hypothetical protein
VQALIVRASSPMKYTNRMSSLPKRSMSERLLGTGLPRSPSTVAERLSAPSGALGDHKKSFVFLTQVEGHSEVFRVEGPLDLLHVIVQFGGAHWAHLRAAAFWPIFEN